MKVAIKIYKGGQAYLGREMSRQGFKGVCDTYSFGITIVIAKPDASLKDIKRSLEITIQDLELRIKQEERNDHKE